MNKGGTMSACPHLRNPERGSGQRKKVEGGGKNGGSKEREKRGKGKGVTKTEKRGRGWQK